MHRYSPAGGTKAHDHDTDGMSRHWALRRRAAAAIAGLAALALVATACGGGSKNPGVASAGGTTTATTSASGSSGSSGSTTTAQPASSVSSSSGPTKPSGSSGSGSSGEASQTQQLQFALCMRSDGVPDFPDPSPSRGLLNAISASGINTRSPTYLAALQACKKYTPAGNMTPAQSATQNTKGLEFSQCMRTHGVPNYPDPSTGPAGEQVIDLRGKGIDPSSPTFQAASEACEKIVPGSK